MGLDDRYVVIQHDPDTGESASIAGMGRNRGTWDTNHSRRRAQHYARQLRAERPDKRFTVESVT